MNFSLAQPKEAALRAKKSCRFSQKLTLLWPFQRVDLTFSSLRSLGIECRPSTEGYYYRKACISSWRHRK